jgi:hypothetical protein
MQVIATGTFLAAFQPRLPAFRQNHPVFRKLQGETGSRRTASSGTESSRDAQTCARSIATGRKLVLNGIVLPLRPVRKARNYRKIWNKERNESPLKTITRLAYAEEEHGGAAVRARRLQVHECRNRACPLL